MLKLVLVFVGSGVGGLLRYLLSGSVHKLLNGTFPLGTLAVNVVGCLLIGFLSAGFSGPLLVREEYRIGLLVGILGGFTTFSAFGIETFAFLNDGQLLRAAANVLLSVGLSLIAVWAGYRLAENWLGV
jgi:fluoride exporter